MARLSAGFWVAAYLRRLGVHGVFAAIVRRGAAEGGAIYVKVNRLDGTAQVYAPATAFDGDPDERVWHSVFGEAPVAEERAQDYLARELRIDPDAWIVEIEDRQGRHLLPLLDTRGRDEDRFFR